MIVARGDGAAARQTVFYDGRHLASKFRNVHIADGAMLRCDFNPGSACRIMARLLT